MYYVSVSGAREWTECLMTRYVIIDIQFAAFSVSFYAICLQCMEKCLFVSVIGVSAILVMARFEHLSDKIVDV